MLTKLLTFCLSSIIIYGVRKILPDNTYYRRIKMDKSQYPYLAYSEITGAVYIVLSKNKKIDVTTQYEFIVIEREVTK